MIVLLKKLIHMQKYRAWLLAKKQGSKGLKQLLCIPKLPYMYSIGLLIRCSDTERSGLMDY